MRIPKLNIQKGLDTGHAQLFPGKEQATYTWAARKRWLVKQLWKLEDALDPELAEIAKAFVAETQKANQNQ